MQIFSEYKIKKSAGSLFIPAQSNFLTTTYDELGGIISLIFQVSDQPEVELTYFTLAQDKPRVELPYRDLIYLGSFYSDTLGTSYHLLTYWQHKLNLFGGRIIYKGKF